MPYGDEFIGVFRGEQVNGIPYIYMGRSKDAIHWDFPKGYWYAIKELYFVRGMD